MSGRKRRVPNYSAAHRPKLGAYSLDEQHRIQEARRAEAARWDDIISCDPEDVSPEDKAWADDYWHRTFGSRGMSA